MGWRSQAVYSGTQHSQMEELGRIYFDTLGIAAPADWAVNNNKPTHYVPKGRYESHVRGLRARMNLNGKFHAQSVAISDINSNYIKTRRKRWFASGSPGDPLEQCFDELLRFATQELPTLAYNRQSLQRIQARIQYIEQIAQLQTVFQPGKIQRKHNKFRAFQQIKQQLRACERLVKRELQRNDTREQLQACSDNISRLLLTTFRYIYHANGYKVHDQAFIPEDYLKNAPSSPYKYTINSHNGQILFEALSLTGLEALNIPAHPEAKTLDPAYAHYFDRTFNPRSFEPLGRVSGLAPWLDGADGLSYIMDLQTTLGGIRLAPLKAIMNKAINLIRREGESWIYGNEPGKLCLAGQLSLVEEVLREFEKNFQELHDFQNSARDGFNETVNKDVIENYKVVNDERKNFFTFCEAIRANLRELRRIASEYAEEEPGQGEELKTQFYDAMINYIERFVPNLNPHAILNPKKITQALERNDNINLEEPLLSKGRIKKGFFAKLMDALFPGEKFPAWRKRYLADNTDDYSKLKKLFKRLDNELNEGPTKAGSINLAHQALRTQIRKMRLKAEIERPRWSLNWRRGISLGWPFYQRKKYHLDRMLEEFKLIQDEVQGRVNQVLNTNVVSLKGQSTESGKLTWSNSNKLRPLQPVYKDGKAGLFQTNVEMTGVNSSITLESKDENRRDTSEPRWHSN